jgi:hypothetical protein
MRHRARAEDIPATIIALLAVESRYRNKFTQEHLTQLERLARGGKLRQAIRSRLEKRQRSVLANDGSQTPYVRHAVDVAMHATATCCRGCIERWHGGALPTESFIKSSDKNLSDAALTHLEAAVHSYLKDFILPAGPVRDFMTELPHKPGERFYEPGEYRIDGAPGQWTVKKVGEGYQGPRTPIKRRNHSNARRRSQHTMDGKRWSRRTSNNPDSLRRSRVDDEELLAKLAVAFRGEK